MRLFEKPSVIEGADFSAPPSEIAIPKNAARPGIVDYPA